MSRSLIAWSLLLIAILAWVCVGALASELSQFEATWETNITQAQDSSAQIASAKRSHALAEDTAQDRAALDQLLDTDVVSIAAQIQAVGKAAGVPLSLGGAESEPSTDPNGIGAVAFAVEGNGTYAQVMQAAELLETLPLPSQITTLDLIHSSDSSTKTPWQVSAEVQVLTDNTSS